MKTQRKSKKEPQPTLPWWRWLLYLGSGLVIYCIIYLKIGGTVPAHATQVAAWRDADAAGNLAIAGVFSGLIVALLKLFLDPVFLGIVHRKSALRIAQELAVSVAQTAVGVAAEGLLSAAAGAASSGGDSASSGDVTSGGGGDFGGGGASGKF
nr:hypothetical protein [Rhodoferax sp.]